MKRIYSVILAIVCSICAVLPLQAEMPVVIPLYFGGFYSDEGAVHIPTNRPLSADSPGSSTIDPVDPNLAKVELEGKILSIRENVEGSVEIVISNYELGKTILDTSFDDSLTVQLTDTATFLIILKLEDEQLAYGMFSYRYPVYLNKKEMKNGLLYIREGNSIYALPGTKIK